jgi:small ligand-binding sensory domain FIST
MLQGIRKRIGNAKPRGALYHTCLARGPNMFEPPETELKIIQAALGDVPLVGLFGNGEISAGRLYTYTGVLTVFL